MMQGKLEKLLPAAEIRYKAELAYEINRIKREKGAIILGHNYMEPALFVSVCDIVGDSLELSRKAAQIKSQTMVFCGVRFMAETAKILSPTKKVLLPTRGKAGCSLASSITAEEVRNLKALFPGAPVITYINTYADVKAETDICCTSGNAAKIVQSYGTKPVIFIPDEYLARNVAAETGRLIVKGDAHGAEMLKGLGTDQPVMIVWNGKCEVHDKFRVEDIVQIRRQFPKVQILAHPECRPEVVAKADFAGSTAKMIDHVRQSDAEEFLLLTECSMGDNIVAENPGKNLLRLCSVRCPHMGEITLEDTLDALRYERDEIQVPEELRARAFRAIDNMLRVA